MTSVDNRSLLDLAQQYSAPGIALAIRLEGLPPGLLQHNPDAQREQEKAAAEHKGRGKFIPTPEQEAEWGAYRNTAGDLCLPTRMLHRCFVEAAKAFKVPKQRVSFTYAVAAALRFRNADTVYNDFALLDPATNKPLSEYETNQMRVVVGRASVYRARPLLETWAMDVIADLDPEAVSPEVFAQIVGYAGQRQGLGDNRPEKGGTYGQFTVTRFEVT